MDREIRVLAKLPDCKPFVSFVYIVLFVIFLVPLIGKTTTRIHSRVTLFLSKHFILATHLRTHTANMASTPPSPSTSVEIEPPGIETPSWTSAPPDIATPVWPPVQPGPVPPHVPTFQFTPTQFSSPDPRPQLHFASNPPGGTVAFQSVPMQLCTSSETSPPSSVSPQRLPGHLPTPGREIHQLTAQVQRNWDFVFDCLKQQDKAVKDLTQEITKTLFLHDTQLGALAAKMESHHQQLLNTITAHNQDEEEGTDKLVKAMNVMVTGELQKSESSLKTEIRFMGNNCNWNCSMTLRPPSTFFKKIKNNFLPNLPEVTAKWMPWMKRYVNSSLK